MSRAVVPPPTRRFWVVQGAVWVVLTLVGIVNEWGERHSVAYQLLFAVVGVLATTRLRHGLLAAAPSRTGLAGVLRWGRVALPVTALAAALADGALLWWLRDAPVPRTVREGLLAWLLPSVGNWLVFLVAWLSVYMAGILLVFTTRAAEERRALERAALDAEARALRMAVNPHFLFNALNSVRALIATDPEGARRMVSELAALMRATLTVAGGTTIALRDDVEIARLYLAIERQRFSDRLAVVVDVDDALDDVVVPPLLLQTLCENAIHHGIGSVPAGGTITLRARRTATGARVTVANPVPATAALAPRPGATGLANARERLARLLGPGAGITLERTAPEMVVATVELPRAARGTADARDAAGQAP